MISALSIYAKLHKGLAEIVNQPVELWHFPCWGASVRSTSGEFARYSESGKPIFPSDFVEFQCNSSVCLCYQDNARLHRGRVIFIGRDKRDTSKMKGKILLTIQLVSELDQLTAANYRLVMSNPVQLQQSELFLLEDVTITAQESSVIQQILDLQLDREFDKVQTVSAATLTLRILCRIIKQRDNSIRPFRYLAPIRGELEIKTFG